MKYSYLSLKGGRATVRSYPWLASLTYYWVVFSLPTTNSYFLVRTEMSVFLVNNLFFIQGKESSVTYPSLGKIIDFRCKKVVVVFRNVSEHCMAINMYSNFNRHF